MESEKNSLVRRNIIIGITISIILTLILFKLFFFPFRIEGDSMSPNLRDGDKILVLRRFLYHSPERFDIVVLKKTTEYSEKIIKRIIALPGETIEIRRGSVFIDGKILPQPFLKASNDVIFRSVNLKSLKIPEKSFYVLGDNRNLSNDSRHFGPVSLNQINGKFLLKYWTVKSNRRNQ